MIGALCAALVLAPAIRAGASLHGTDDGDEFLLRALTLDLALHARAAYPRWLPDLYLGHGYPVFSFYSPLAYVVVVAMRHLVATTVDVAATVVVAGIVTVAGAGAASLARSMALGDGAGRDGWRGVTIGTVAALAYTVAPYPFVTNILLRGAIPEALGLAILPWTWLAARRLVQGNARDVVAVGLLGALAVMAHQLGAVLAGAALALVVAAHAGPGGIGRRLPGLGRVAAAGLLVIGNTAAFWVPLVAEADAVHLDVVRHGADVVVARLSPWWAPVVASWPYPHGWDAWLARAPEGPVLPGVVQGGILALSLVVGAGRVVARRAPSGPRDGRRAADATGALLVVVTCWVLNLDLSAPAWAGVATLRVIQFPWRLLGPLSLGVAVLGAMAIARARVAAIAMAAIAVGALSAAESLGALPYPVAPDGARRYDVAAMVEDDYAYDRWGASTTTGDGEFTPRTVDIRRPDGSLGGPVRLDRLAPPGAWVGGLAMVASGEGDVAALHGDALRLRAVVEAGAAGATLAVHQLAFPGWRATVDGARADVRAAPEVLGSGVTPGWVTVAVPPGRHEVAAWFGATWPRLVGDAITCATLAAVALVLARAWRRGTARPVGTSAVTGALLALATWNLAAEAWTVRSPAAASPASERIVLDVVEAVRRGDGALASPSGSRLGPDAFLDAGWLDVRPPPGRPQQIGTRRRWLYMHPPARATVRVRIPAGGATFQSGMALRPEAWDAPVGDGVHFVVEAASVAESGAPRRLAFQRVNPRANVDERRWVEVRADLGEWAGREVDLTLRTEPVDMAAYDWAGWGNPLVVVPSGMIRPANGPQPPASVAAPRTWMVDQ